MAMTPINNEDRLVQATFAQHLELVLGWDSVFAWNEETIGFDGTFGRDDTKQAVLTRDLRAALERLNPELVSGRKPPLSHEICDEPPHFRRGFGHGTGHTDTTEGCSASNRSTFSTSGHRRPFPSPWAGPRGGRSPQEMAALRQRGDFDVVRPHACAVAQADRCGAGWRPVSTMQRCVQTHRRRGSAPGRDRDAQGC